MPNSSPAVASDEQVAAILAAMHHEPGDRPWAVDRIEDVDTLAYIANNCGVEWMRGVCVWDTSDTCSEDCMITYDLPDGGLRLCSLTISLKYFLTAPGTSSEGAVLAALETIKNERDAMAATLADLLAAAGADALRKRAGGGDR